MCDLDTGTALDVYLLLTGGHVECKSMDRGPLGLRRMLHQCCVPRSYHKVSLRGICEDVMSFVYIACQYLYTEEHHHLLSILVCAIDSDGSG